MADERQPIPPTPAEADGADITATLNAVRKHIGEADGLVFKQPVTGEILGCELSIESLRELTAQLKELKEQSGKEFVPVIRDGKWNGAFIPAPAHIDE